MVKCRALHSSTPTQTARDAVAWVRDMLSELGAASSNRGVRIVVGLPPSDPSTKAWRSSWQAEGLHPAQTGRHILWHPGLPSGSADPFVEQIAPSDSAALNEAAAVNARAFSSPVAVSRYFLDPNVVEPYAVRQNGHVAAVGCRYWAGGIWAVYSLGTHPDHRRQGLASKLLTRLASGTNAVVLDTMEPTVAFYRHRGFHPVTTLEEWTGTLAVA